MKFLKHSICLICLVAVMACFTLTALADDKVSFSGGKIIFPDNDSIPDGNIADLKFNLDKVPPDLKFMAGKVYRAQGKNSRYNVSGLKMYIFLYDWNEENMKFQVANSGAGSFKAMVYRMTCLSKLSQEFNCTNRAGKAIFRFSVQEGKPVLDAATGGNFVFEEAATIPADILKQAGK
jgi:hypothetical protein